MADCLVTLIVTQVSEVLVKFVVVDGNLAFNCSLVCHEGVRDRSDERHKNFRMNVTFMPHCIMMLYTDDRYTGYDWSLTVLP